MDARAGRAIARAVRRAGSATAISPFPVLDMLAAAVIDARLVGELARIYGGRPGALAGLRLLRTAFVNVLAAGGLDTIEDAAGDLVGTGLTARLSTRAGAALVNGLLTARIGLAAADACRPLPWRARRRPSARRFVRSALTGRSSERG
jgi:putative membrane protein